MKHIAILGAGYGGIAAALVLQKQLKNNPDIEITLFDKNPFHTLMTELHEVAGGSAEPESVQISLHKIFQHSRVKVQIEKIKDIDFEARVVQGELANYSYDYLIVSPGAQSDYFGIPGAQENSFSLWSYDDAIKLRRHIEDQFLKASREVDPAQRSKTLTFVVAGAGFTGIEILGELLQRRKTMCNRYDIDEKEVSIQLIEAHAAILPVLPAALRKKALKFVTKNGGIVRLNFPINQVTKDAVIAKDGTTIATETLIWTCGIKGSDLAGKLDAATADAAPTAAVPEKVAKLQQTLMQKCRLQTNEFMQSVDYPAIYVAGDVIWYAEKIVALPQVVETALQTAQTAAQNIAAEINGRDRIPFEAHSHGFVISIGSDFAVADGMGLSFSGGFAMFIKHLVNLHYLWGVGGFKACLQYVHHHL